MRITYIVKFINPREKKKIIKYKQNRINMNLVSIRIVPDPIEDDYPLLCPICHDIMDDNIIKLSNCIHMYHQSCIMDWIERKYPIISCPICRNGDAETTRLQQMQIES